MYEIYINPGPRGSTFVGDDVRRHKTFGTRIAAPKASAVVIEEIAGESGSVPAFLVETSLLASSSSLKEV